MSQLHYAMAAASALMAPRRSSPRYPTRAGLANRTGKAPGQQSGNVFVELITILPPDRARIF